MGDAGARGCGDVDAMRAQRDNSARRIGVQAGRRGGGESIAHAAGGP